MRLYNTVHDISTSRLHRRLERGAEVRLALLTALAFSTYISDHIRVHGETQAAESHS